jgi:hypothetical protein
MAKLAIAVHVIATVYAVFLDTGFADVGVKAQPLICSALALPLFN